MGADFSRVPRLPWAHPAYTMGIEALPLREQTEHEDECVALSCAKVKNTQSFTF